MNEDRSVTPVVQAGTRGDARAVPRMFTERRRLVPGAFRVGAGSLPDQCGVVTCPAFLGVVDDLLRPAACLCCCRAPTREAMAQAAEQLAQILNYFSPESYRKAGARRRLAEMLAGPAARPPGRGVPRPLLLSPGVPVSEAGRRLERIAGRLCRARPVAAYPLPHGWQVSREKGVLGRAGLALVLVASREARRLARRLGAECKRRGLALATRAVSDAEMFLLRFKWRSSLVDVYEAGASPRPALERLEEAARRAVKTFERARKKGKPQALPTQARPSQTRPSQTRNVSEPKRRSPPPQRHRGGNPRGGNPRGRSPC